MKKLMMGLVVCGAMALLAEQNAASVKIAETYKGKTAALAVSETGRIDNFAKGLAFADDIGRRRE